MTIVSGERGDKLKNTKKQSMNKHAEYFMLTRERNFTVGGVSGYLQ
jgi:hypothetical protein